MNVRKLAEEPVVDRIRKEMLDSHNHLQSARFGRSVEQLVAEMKQQGVSGCVVNGTREDDWDAVAELARIFPGYVVPAFGIHPWFAGTATAGWEDRLRRLLEGNEQATIGEIGLDGWVEGPGMEVQQKVFLKQVEIAREFGRVATIHCLKAWEQLFELDEWPEKFLMHSFGGPIEVAQRLMKKGDAYFSFSGYFLQERKAKVLEVYRQLPQERILLETDAPEMAPPPDFVEFPLEGEANHPGNLTRIAAGFEKALGGDGLARISRNGIRFWGFK